jgi:hypothetical protein
MRSAMRSGKIFKRNFHGLVLREASDAKLPGSGLNGTLSASHERSVIKPGTAGHALIPTGDCEKWESVEVIAVLVEYKVEHGARINWFYLKDFVLTEDQLIEPHKKKEESNTKCKNIE